MPAPGATWAADMRDNFERCLSVTLRWEGGWSDHPDDPGGATMKGITIGTYSGWKGRRVTKDELRAITDDEVRTIYRRKYWDAVRGDDLPAGLDLVAFDGAVNSGPARGARWLQQALDVPADGRIGPVTLGAARGANAIDAITAACRIRLAFLRGLRTWGTFGRGWENRVRDVERSAHEMALRSTARAHLPVAEPRAPDRSPIARLLRKLAQALRR